LLINLSSPDPGIPSRPSTPKVMQARECTPTPFSSVIFTFELAVESIKEFGGASKLANDEHLVFQSLNFCSIYFFCIWDLKMKCKPLDYAHTSPKIIQFGF
jgi:hypothetical protein